MQCFYSYDISMIPIKKIRVDTHCSLIKINKKLDFIILMMFLFFLNNVNKYIIHTFFIYRNNHNKVDEFNIIFSNSVLRKINEDYKIDYENKKEGKVKEEEDST